MELLLALGEPAEELCAEFLAHARGRLEAELRSLEAELGPSPPAPDVLEFTDHGGSGFVGGLCQVASAYQELFAAQGPAGAEKLAAFARELGGRYFALVERRLAQEQGSGDNSLLVRALDRFHRRLRAPGALLAAAGLAEAATEIVERVARERLGHHLQGLRAAFLGCLTDVRQALAAPRLAGKEGPGLAELLANVASSILSHIKASLAAVHLFTAKEVSFSNKPYFRVWPAFGHPPPASPRRLILGILLFILEFDSYQGTQSLPRHSGYGFRLSQGRLAQPGGEGKAVRASASRVPSAGFVLSLCTPPPHPPKQGSCFWVLECRMELSLGEGLGHLGSQKRVTSSPCLEEGTCCVSGALFLTGRVLQPGCS